MNAIRIHCQHIFQFYLFLKLPSLKLAGDLKTVGTHVRYVGARGAAPEGQYLNQVMMRANNSKGKMSIDETPDSYRKCLPCISIPSLPYFKGDTDTLTAGDIRSCVRTL